MSSLFGLSGLSGRPRSSAGRLYTRLVDDRDERVLQRLPPPGGKRCRSPNGPSEASPVPVPCFSGPQFLTSPARPAIGGPMLRRALLTVGLLLLLVCNGPEVG